MTAQDLKNAILQLAVQGKLVPQDPNDEPALELLKRVEAEKATLIEAGKIKKFKTLVELSADDLPFDIPDSWCWIKLGNICQLMDGEKTTGKGFPYLEVKFLRGKVSATIQNQGKFVSKGTRLILVDGENSGEVFAATEDGYMGSTFKVLFFPNELFEKYVLYFLQFKQLAFRNNKTGSAIPHLNKDLFFNMPFPVPPITEQQRIVAKIEELIPLVEEYGKAEERLTALNAEFPEKIRKSILQHAIQGKLTERDPSDEPASELLKRIRAEKEQLIKEGKIKKEKPLSPITEEEIPFEIPYNWHLVRLGDILSVSSGSNVTSAEMAKTKQLYPVYGGNGITGYYDKYNVEKDTLVIGRVGFYCGSIHLTRDKAWVTDNALIVKYDKTNLLTEFLQLLLSYADFGRKSESTAQPLVTGKIIKPYVAAIPPLAEQQRIVDRVNELLALCDELK